MLELGRKQVVQHLDLVIWTDWSHHSHTRVFRIIAILDRSQRQFAQICQLHSTQSNFSGIMFLCTSRPVYYTILHPLPKEFSNYNQSCTHVSDPLNGTTTCVELELCQPMDTMNDWSVLNFIMTHSTFKKILFITKSYWWMLYISLSRK